ncbi:uncharacterized protein LOC129566390 isoform X2 [Sitodiplosis mosellana]|uniref:uncharacterized protein LOC129566390 isoform X2 n=1 Tax=Sitodiplosis mosellana TaxID=263140 RepID=UPI002444E4AA|nr:uncharacterized protein LOC129566390 isoform X2 [Sitodiplosis mosellana]
MIEWKMKWLARFTLVISICDGQQKYGRYELRDNTTTINQVNGMCCDGKSEQYILIHWMETGSHDLMNLTFHRNEKSRGYSLNRIDFNLSAKLLANGTDEMLTFHYTGDIFQVPLGMSYHCSREDTFELKSSEHTNDSVGTFHFSQIMAEAYRTTTNTFFSTAIDCSFSRKQHGIFIALGIAIILFVLFWNTTFGIEANRPLNTNTCHSQINLNFKCFTMFKNRLIGFNGLLNRMSSTWDI